MIYGSTNVLSEKKPFKALKMHKEYTQLIVYSYHVTRTLPFACPTANKFSGSDFGYHAMHYITNKMSSKLLRNSKEG